MYQYASTKSYIVISEMLKIRNNESEANPCHKDKKCYRKSRIAWKKYYFQPCIKGFPCSGPDCKKQVERFYPKSHYTVRTYEKWIPKLTPEVIAIYNGLLDHEWSLGIMNLYSGLPHIMPEAVPYILRIKELQKPSNNLLIGMKVSVRQARWISYLFTFMSDDISLFGWYFVRLLAAELNYELKEPKPLYFDTSEYDNICLTKLSN